MELWLWLGDGEEWQVFSEDHGRILEDAHVAGNDAAILSRADGTQMFCDLVALTQTNLTTSHSRKIRRGWPDAPIYADRIDDDTACSSICMQASSRLSICAH